MSSTEPAERVPGEMEKAVRADISRLKLNTGMRATLAQSAFVLARAVDSYSEQAESAAQLSAIAKAIQELRSTMDKLMAINTDDESARADAEEMSTPVGGEPL